MTDTADLQTILREQLRQSLGNDLVRRINREPKTAVYDPGWDQGNDKSAKDADLSVIRERIAEFQEGIAANDLSLVMDFAEVYIKEHGLADDLLRPLAVGMMEISLQFWKVAEQRTLGVEPLVFEPQTPGPAPPLPPLPPMPPVSGPSGTEKPSASGLVDAFGAWGLASGGWRAGAEGQAKASMGLFLEVCGDRPVDAYTAADGDKFRSTLRQLPPIYRKSAKDRNKPLQDIIKDAAASTARLSEKTIKRHFWAVSRFFAFLVETGQLPRGAENPARGFTFNIKGSARKQRDMWRGDELSKLFASPIWTGCHRHYRAQAGDKVIRDALFWLPLLGLFHGNRLEEFAQLRRDDVGQEEGVWYLDITDEDGRQLKNEQSRRKVPLHPELIRVGLLDYIAEATTGPEDQIFPDLKPGGRDRKLGYYFSKEFSAYRKKIGVRRRGLDYHSFRHGATTKLFQAEVSEAWVDLLTGHDHGGGESRRRYLKEIPLPQLRAALEKVTWPEVDLSGLYIRKAGDETWPVKVALAAA